jgi:hypothetical protein
MNWGTLNKVKFDSVELDYYLKITDKKLKYLTDRKHIPNKCNYILTYLFLVGFSLSILNSIEIDTKVFGILTTLCIAISDLRYSFITEVSDSKITIHLLYATFSFSLMLFFDTRSNFILILLKFSFLLIIILHIHIIYNQKKFNEKNFKKRQKKEVIKAAQLRNSIVTIEKINSGITNKQRIAIKNTDSYEKLVYEMD